MDKENLKRKSINVKLLNINNGLVEYDNVKFIKLKSKHYNLIIKEYDLPIIGEIEGDVKIELVNNVIELKNIKGYFMSKKNQFNLFIKEEDKNEWIDII